MLAVALFLIELGLLFYLSKILIRNLARLFYKLTRSHSGVVNCLAILFLPGTIIHELSHLLVAGITLVPVGEVEIFPEVREDGVRLGSVQIGQSDPFRRTLIGVAPVLLGLFLILGMIYFFKDSLMSLSPLWQVLLVIYLIFEIANTMFSSKKDLEGVVVFASAILIVILLILGALLLTGNISWLNFLTGIDYSGLVNLFKVADTFLLIPLIIDLGLLGLTKLVR